MSTNHGPHDERPLNPAFDELRAKRAAKPPEVHTAKPDIPGLEAYDPAKHISPDNLQEARGFGFVLGLWIALGTGICIGVVWLKWVVPVLMKLPHH